MSHYSYLKRGFTGQNVLLLPIEWEYINKSEFEFISNEKLLVIRPPGLMNVNEIVHVHPFAYGKLHVVNR